MHSLPTFWVELVLGQLAAFCISKYLPRVCTDQIYETAIWLTRALNKLLGAYSLLTAEKQTAVVKQRKPTGEASRGSTRTAPKHGLWGKSGDIQSLGKPPRRRKETSSAGSDKRNSMHNAPRVLS